MRWGSTLVRWVDGHVGGLPFFSFRGVKVLYSLRECSKLGIARNGRPVASTSLVDFWSHESVGLRLPSLGAGVQPVARTMSTSIRYDVGGCLIPPARTGGSQPGWSNGSSQWRGGGRVSRRKIKDLIAWGEKPHPFVRYRESGWMLTRVSLSDRVMVNKHGCMHALSETHRLNLCMPWRHGIETPCLWRG